MSNNISPNSRPEEVPKEAEPKKWEDIRWKWLYIQIKSKYLPILLISILSWCLIGLFVIRFYRWLAS